MTNPRLISANLSSLKDVKLHEYALRFVFGGLCTVAAGLIAKRFGAAIGGLFLAFPAIFPAGASLLEAHEKRKMAKSGLDGTKQGREPVADSRRGWSMSARFRHRSGAGWSSIKAPRERSTHTLQLSLF
jgi:hypothetical protein